MSEIEQGKEKNWFSRFLSLIATAIRFIFGKSEKKHGR